MPSALEEEEEVSGDSPMVVVRHAAAVRRGSPEQGPVGGGQWQEEVRFRKSKCLHIAVEFLHYLKE
jgi:hypothetical protein